jgi:hypothetical protein
MASSDLRDESNIDDLINELNIIVNDDLLPYINQRIILSRLALIRESKRSRQYKDYNDIIEKYLIDSSDYTRIESFKLHELKEPQLLKKIATNITILKTLIKLLFKIVSILNINIDVSHHYNDFLTRIDNKLNRISESLKIIMKKIIKEREIKDIIEEAKNNSVFTILEEIEPYFNDFESLINYIKSTEFVEVGSFIDKNTEERRNFRNKILSLTSDFNEDPSSFSPPSDDDTALDPVSYASATSSARLPSASATSSARLPSAPFAPELREFGLGDTRREDIDPNLLAILDQIEDGNEELSRRINNFRGGFNNQNKKYNYIYKSIKNM